MIVGSARPGRAADQFIPWVVARAEAHEAFEVELLDLRDWPLPLFQNADPSGQVGWICGRRGLSL